MEYLHRLQTILLCVACAWTLSGCLASTGPQAQLGVERAQPPAHAMQPCPEQLPPLRGSQPDGSATAGDMLLWRRVDVERWRADCAKRHVDLIDYTAKELGGAWLPMPAGTAPAQPGTAP